MSNRFNPRVPSTRIVKGDAVKLDAATMRSIQDREDSNEILEELKSIQPVSSPFTELFFDGAPAVNEPLVAEPTKETNVDLFDDAFLDSPKQLLVDDGAEEFDESSMTVDEPMNMQWTRKRITSQDETISALSEMNSSYNDRISLTKDMLAAAEIIAQVEDKFIIIKTQGKLCIVDQHAADERVALEKLENALFNPNLHESMRIEMTKKHLLVGDILKGISVMPAKRVALSKSQIDVIKQHHEILARWHFTYKTIATGDESVLLTGVPSICGRVTDANDFLEFVNALQHSMGGQVKPECVKRILASQACRYAIMFGDRLTDKQCRQLITNLSKCDFAFICAHGRPSVIPLIDLGEEDSANDNKLSEFVCTALAANDKISARSSLRGPMRVIRQKTDG